MATVQHPTWPEISREVDGRSVPRWEKAGWKRTDKPQPRAEKPEKPAEG